MLRYVFRCWVAIAAATIGACASDVADQDTSSQTVTSEAKIKAAASRSVTAVRSRAARIIKHADANLDQSTFTQASFERVFGAPAKHENSTLNAAVASMTDNAADGIENQAANTVQLSQSGWTPKPNVKTQDADGVPTNRGPAAGVISASSQDRIYRQLYGDASEALGADSLNSDGADNAGPSNNRAQDQRSAREIARRNAFAKAIAVAALSATQNASVEANRTENQSAAVSSDTDDQTADRNDQPVNSEPEIPQIGAPNNESSAALDQVTSSEALDCPCENEQDGVCVSVSDATACVEQPAIRSGELVDDPEALERLRRRSEAGGPSDEEADARLALGLASQIPPESWSLQEFSSVLETLIGDAATQLGPDQEASLRSALNAQAEDLFPIFTGISYRQRTELFLIEGFDVSVTYGCILLAKNDLRAIVRVPFSGATNQCEL